MAKYKAIFLFIAIIGTSSASYFDNTPTDGRQKYTHGTTASASDGVGGKPSNAMESISKLGPNSSRPNGETGGVGSISGGHSSTDRFSAAVSSSILEGSKSRPGTVKRPIIKPGSSNEFQSPSDVPVGASVGAIGLGSSSIDNKEGYTYNAPANGQTFTLGSSSVSANGIGSRPSVSSLSESTRPGAASDIGSRPSVSNGVGSRPGVFDGVSSRPGATHGLNSQSVSNGVGSRPGTAKRPSSRPGSLVGIQSPSDAPTAGAVSGASVHSSGTGSSAVGNKEEYTYNESTNGQAFTLGSSSVTVNGIGSRPLVSSLSESRPGAASDMGSRPSVSNSVGSRPGVLGGVSSGPGVTHRLSSQAVSSGIESRPGTVKRPSSRPGSLVGIQSPSDAPIAGEVSEGSVSSIGSGLSSVGSKEGYTYNGPVNGQSFTLGSSSVSANGIGSRPSVSSLSESTRPGAASDIGSIISVSNGDGSRPGVLGGVSSGSSVTDRLSSQAVSSGIEGRPGTVKRPSSRPGSLVGIQSPSDAPTAGDVSGASVDSSRTGSSAVGNKEEYTYNVPTNGQAFTLGSSSVAVNGIGSRPLVSSLSESRPGAAGDIGSRPSVSNGVGIRPGVLGGVSSRPSSTNDVSSQAISSGVGSRPSVSNGEGNMPRFPSEVSNRPVAPNGSSRPAPSIGMVSKPSPTNGLGAKPGVTNGLGSRPGSESTSAAELGSKINGHKIGTTGSASGTSNKKGYNDNTPTTGVTITHGTSSSVGFGSSSGLEPGKRPDFFIGIEEKQGIFSGGGSRPISGSGTGSRPVTSGQKIIAGATTEPGSGSIGVFSVSGNGHGGFDPSSTLGSSVGGASSSIAFSGSSVPSGFGGNGALATAGGLGGFGSGTNGNGIVGGASGLLDDEIQNIPVLPIEALAQAIPGGGTPGIDYPILASIPKSEFACDSLPGYYADTGAESQCQVFHICQEDGRQDSFLCPNGTLFNQKYFVCDWWFNVDCSISSQYYELNAEIGIVTTGASSGVGELGAFGTLSGSLEVESTGAFDFADDPSVLGVSGISTIDSNEFGVHASGTKGMETQGVPASGVSTHGSSGGLQDQIGSVNNFLAPALSSSGFVVPSGTAGGFGEHVDTSGSFVILAGGATGQSGIASGSTQRVGASLGGAVGINAPGSGFGSAVAPSIIAGETTGITTDSVSSHTLVGGIAAFGQAPIHGSALGSENVGATAAVVPSTLYAVSADGNRRPNKNQVGSQSINNNDFTVTAFPLSLYIPPRKI